MNHIFDISAGPSMHYLPNYMHPTRESSESSHWSTESMYSNPQSDDMTAFHSTSKQALQHGFYASSDSSHIGDDLLTYEHNASWSLYHAPSAFYHSLQYPHSPAPSALSGDDSDRFYQPGPPHRHWVQMSSVPSQRLMTPVSPELSHAFAHTSMFHPNDMHNTGNSMNAAPQALMQPSPLAGVTDEASSEIEEDAVGEPDDAPDTTLQTNLPAKTRTPQPMLAGSETSEESLSSDTDSDEPIASGTESDTDYVPGRTRRRSTALVKNRNRRKSSSAKNAYRVEKPNARRPSLGRKRSSTTGNTATAISRARPSQSNAAKSSGDKEKPFTCPLSPYGCLEKFSSKNEWKRHITIQHLALGVFHCDECNDYRKPPNQFNRKDLFTSHLRRMHYKDQELSGQQLDEIHNRCWKKSHDPPARFYDVFEDKPYQGNRNSVDEWLEHLAKKLVIHVGADGEDKDKASKAEIVAELWKRDYVLREWLIDEGMLRSDSAGQWQITRLHGKGGGSNEDGN